MTPRNRSAAQRLRPALLLIGLLLGAAGLVALVPAWTPAAMAGRVFQSPLATPTTTATARAPRATATVVPTRPASVTRAAPTVSATATEGAPADPNAPARSKIPTPTPIVAITREATGPTPTRAPLLVITPQAPLTASAEGRWIRFIDTTVKVFSYLWLICGAIALMAVVLVVLLVTIYSRRSRARVPDRR